MLRSIALCVLLLILSSCISSSGTHTSNVIPNQTITSETLAPYISDEGKTNIALLTPFENNKNHLGSSIIKASEIAISNAGNPDVNLLLLNSHLINQDPDLLLQQLKTNNIKAIVGPVFSKETQNLIELIKETAIPVLTLSNDSSIKGDSLLIMGSSPGSQASALINYAIGKSINHFYIALPSNKYGKVIEEAVAEEANKKTSITYSVTWYNPKDPSYTIDSLVKSISNKINDNNALFVPQGGNVLNILNTALVKYKLKINLIGSKSWDDNEILDLPLFNGAILVLKNDQKEQIFFSEYNQLFHEDANNIDFIAYNSIKFLAEMIRENQPLNKENIISFSPDQFDQDGVSIHKMRIVEINQKTFKPVE
jgi:branched-chain amino acid transport system substrate-binding protein